MKKKYGTSTFSEQFVILSVIIVFAFLVLMLIFQQTWLEPFIDRPFKLSNFLDIIFAVKNLA